MPACGPPCSQSPALSRRFHRLRFWACSSFRWPPSARHSRSCASGVSGHRSRARFHRTHALCPSAHRPQHLRRACRGRPGGQRRRSGMGMSSLQLLARVELPLAAPLIVDGVRTAAVLLIGITALTVFAGARNLGILIFEGLGQFAPDLILLGALPIIALAVAVDVVLSALGRAVTPKGPARDHVRERHEALWREDGRRLPHVRGPARRSVRADRAIRVRQDDDATNGEPPHRAHERPDPRERRRRHHDERGRAPARSRLRDPVRRSLPASHRGRQHRRGPAAPGLGQSAHRRAC